MTVGERVRITAPRIHQTAAGWARLSAPVSVGQRRMELYYEVPTRLGDLLAPRTDAFLPAVAVLARGSDVIQVEGADPGLVDGVRTVLMWLAHWYPTEYGRVPAIENAATPAHQRPVARSASLLSGGIDSLALIRHNHGSFPEGHLGRISAGLLVNWNVDVDRRDVTLRRAYFDRLAQRLESAGLGIEIVQVRSNLTSVAGRDDLRWSRASHGACFAGVAHALGAGFGCVRIGSSYQLRDLKPWGSHPLIDNELSSASVRFAHDGLAMTRMEKTRIVADWPEGAAVASVCIGNYGDRLAKWNCGACEKCVRTAASFTAAGYPASAERLIGRHVTSEDIARLRLTSDVAASFWADIANEAGSSGNAALERAARRLVERYRVRRMLQRAATPLGIRRMRAALRRS